MRTISYGQSTELSPVDRIGVWLSSRHIRRAIGSVRGLRAGDFGCGYRASIAAALLNSAADLILVDLAIDPTAKALPNTRVIEGELPGAIRHLPRECLDVVLCISVLEHLDAPLETLQEIRRVLAPGGIAVINVPTWFGKRLLEFSAFRLGLSPREEMDDHRTYYDPRDLWPLLVRAGFRPHEITCRRHKFGVNTFAICRVDGRPEMAEPT